MDHRRSSRAFRVSREESDTHTDDIDLEQLQDVKLTKAERISAAGVGASVEANVILIAHPEGKRLGSRYRLGVGTRMEIGRDPRAGISLPEVPSISRRHAILRYSGQTISIEDLGSTNGTYVNGDLARERTTLKSGDRFQVAAVHFKLLHEQDVENAYYHAISELVTRDGLTEVFNKRKFEEEFEREMARARRYRRPLALVLFDLDTFKEINDGFGHLCGDFVLKRVAMTVGEALRPEQMFARVGGDEFAILCPETDAEGAFTLAERLCDQVAGLDYSYCDFRVAVTCSFGVAELGADMSKAEDLYAAADRALYASKHAGRNRVSRLPESSPAAS